MVVPFMTMYATQKLHYSIIDAGIIMALFGAGSIVGAFLGGKLTDAIGFYKIQVFALFGGGIMFIVVGYLQSYPALCIGTFVLSLVNESFRPANSTAIAHYSKPENRTRSYSLNRLAINLGWAVGGALGGMLASYNYHLLFWVDGLTNISAGVILLLVLPVPVNLKSTIAKNKANQDKASSPYHDRQYLFFIFLTVLFAFSFFQMFTILPVFLKQKLQLDEKLIGVLMAINGMLIAVIEMVVVFKLEAKAHPIRFVKFGVWLVGASYIVFNLFTGHFFLALISTLVITFGEMLSMPFMNTYWISRSKEHNRGQYAALYTMAWGTAQIVAPSLGGFIAERYSFNALWWFVFAITVVAGWGYHRLALLSKESK
jgi:predicted MFS family arabinose efflux permease